MDAAGLTDDMIRSAFGARKVQAMEDKPNGLVPASVLIGLFQQDSPEWRVLFTRRTNRVERHKGQVAFPGGASESSDQDAVETALREASEEIGLPRSCVNVLGCMQRMPTVTGFCITPVVAFLCWPFDVRPEEAEVEKVFSVPLSWLVNPENREERPYTRSNGSQENVIFFKIFDGEIIWGATAKIMVDFIKILEGV